MDKNFLGVTNNLEELEFRKRVKKEFESIPEIDGDTIVLNEYGQIEASLKISDSISPISIKPTTPLTELNALPDGVYRAASAGTYQFTTLPDYDVVVNKVVPEGYSVKFLKDASGWSVAVVEKLPEINARIVDVPIQENPNVSLNGEIRGNFLSGYPTENLNSPNYLTNYISVNPNTEYEIFTSDGTLLSSALYAYDSNKESSRRIFNITEYPITITHDRIVFKTLTSEFYIALYTKYDNVINTSIYNKLVVRENVETKPYIEIREKVVKPIDIINSETDAIKSIAKEDNSFYALQTPNLYNGVSYTGKYFNTTALDGTLVVGGNNAYTDFIPVNQGKVYLSAPGFAGGVSNRVYGYTTKEYFNGVPIGNSSSASETLELDIPEGVNYISTYTQATALGGNNSDFLQVTQISDGNIGIKLGGESRDIDSILENSNVINAIIEDVNSFKEKNLYYSDIPYYTVSEELSALDATAIIPKSWRYKDIIKNVFEPLRTSNSDYISLIGNYTQNIDSTLPIQSIGLSLTNGSRPQFPLYLYDFKPVGYEKTVLLFSCEHGNEQESTITLCRFLQIMMQETNNPQMSYLRTKVRFIICPVLNPYGYDYDTRLNAKGVDMNRNYDFNFESYDNSNYGNFNGVVPPVMSNENKLLVDALKPYLDEIDFAFSYHTGFTNSYPYWINCPLDAINRNVIENTMRFLCSQNNVNYNVMGLTSEVNYNSVSAHYFSKILQIPTCTVDYVCQFPQWGERWGSKAMTIYLEQVINLIIAQCYEDVTNKSLSTVTEFQQQIFPTPVSEEHGHFQKITKQGVDNIFTNKLANFNKEVIGTSTNGNEILAFTHQATEEEKRKVILIGGVFSKINTKRIFNYASQTSNTVEYIDGGRHVVLFSDLGKLWDSDTDVYFNEIKKHTTLVIIPVINVDSFYTASNQINYDYNFITSDNNEFAIVRNFISENKGAKYIIINETTNVNKYFDLKFSPNYPYAWKNANVDLQKYINTLDASLSYSESNIMKYITLNDSSGVIVNHNGLTSSDYGMINWSTKNTTQLGNTIGNLIGMI